MPITQFFTNGKFTKSTDGGPLSILECADIELDSIGWEDADVITNSFKQFAIDKQLGSALSFVLTKETITELLAQASGEPIDGLKIYLGYCNEDKTIRAFTVASKLNSGTGEYDDIQVPTNMAGVDPVKMPLIGNLRPCPPQCGITNVLNRKLP